MIARIVSLLWGLYTPFATKERCLTDHLSVIQADLAPYALVGEEVTLEARVRSTSKSNLHDELILEVISDGHVLSAIFDREAVGISGWEDAQALTAQSLLRINGRVQPSAKPHSSPPVYTVRVTKLVVLAKATRDLPSFRGGELSESLRDRLDNRILDQRAAASGAMFKLLSGMSQLIVEFFTANDFFWLHTPRLRGSHVAGDNEYFHVPYFGRDAWLCQHTQHALQGAIGMDMKRVFDIGPVFRAESKSVSSARHMSEV